MHRNYELFDNAICAESYTKSDKHIKLQSKQETLAEATTIINSVITTLKDKRC